jgi:predicted dehydrogenase
MSDMMVYELHNITGILGAAKQVTGMSGTGLKQRSLKGERIDVDMDDNTHLVLDFGDELCCTIFGTNSYTNPGGPGRYRCELSGG